MTVEKRKRNKGAREMEAEEDDEGSIDFFLFLALCRRACIIIFMLSPPVIYFYIINIFC